MSGHALFDTAEEYYAYLIGQADVTVERLAGKVEKAERDLDVARAAHAEAAAAAQRLRDGDLPEFVRPTSSARVSAG